MGLVGLELEAEGEEGVGLVGVDEEFEVIRAGGEDAGGLKAPHLSRRSCIWVTRSSIGRFARDDLARRESSKARTASSLPELKAAK